MLKKNNHTYKTIFTWFSSFSTFTKLQGFHYYQRKKYKCGSIVFFSFSLKKTTTTRNPNHQKLVSTSCAQDSQ